MINQERMEALVPAQPSPANVRRESVDAPGGVYHAYINHIVVAYTSYDILLRLGFLERMQEFLPSDAPTLRLENRATVAMAWSEAKALRNMLSDLIQKFEALNGEIKTGVDLP
jgi:hypothetical protein